MNVSLGHMRDAIRTHWGRRSRFIDWEGDTGLFWFILTGLACGCVIGFFAGLVAGVINGAVISALTGPFALRRGNPLARRLRAVLVVVTTTEAALLPVQLTLGHGAPITDIALLTTPILAAALCLATTIAPAG